MNLAFKRELELAEFDALSGDAEKFFDREERLIAMDIHGDVLQMNLLNKCKLIASFRTDRFVTAKELWQKMNSTLRRGEKKELWGQVWSVPEANTPVYEELVHAIMKDPTKSSGTFSKKVAMVAMLLILIGGGGSIWWSVENGKTDNLNEVQDSISTTPSTGASDGTNPSTRRALYNTEDLFNKVSPSVVMFVAIAKIQLSNGRNIGWPLGHGTGFVIDASGLVMTNKHVSSMFPTNEFLSQVRDAGDLFQGVDLYAIVRDPNTRVIISKGVYNSPRNDVAIVQIDNVHLPALELANSNPNIGVDVVVVGYRAASMRFNQIFNEIDEKEARQRFNLSDTSALIDMYSPNEKFLPTSIPGTISGIMQFSTHDRSDIYDAIETSAMTGGGNSGGPMLNMHSQIVGVLTMGDNDRTDADGNVVHVGHSAVNVCIGVEEIHRVLADWRATQQ